MITKMSRYGQIIYNEKDTKYGVQLNQYGEYCDVQTRVFKELVKKGNKVIEIGANYGCHTLLFSLLVGDGIVQAFEPNRLPYYCLCGTIALNNITNVYCRQQQIGDEDRQYRISDLNQNYPQDFCSDLIGTGNSYNVKMLQLDAVGPCDLVKISSNNPRHAHAVLNGGEDIINRYKPSIYIAAPFGNLALLHEWGYKTYLHIPRLFNDHNVAKNNLNVLGNAVEQNFLAIHPDRKISLDLEFLDLDEITEDIYDHVNPSVIETQFMAEQHTANSLKQLAAVYDLSGSEMAQECLKLAEKLN